ncbi:hypothetical protein CF327_g151 [Tilletia walkeri]|uniref:Flavin-nucleotide-binding protein n=1 Tax=Tilletia walkeri TaxID=117179 RepID=A0A8X7NBU4_9BASI|nr:hypothetical protein CF327_g151 [Tilletia walkeri]KAE8271036.1 hypothetical protein A4X09_0g1287 [Tilletia walkeri]
MSTSSYEKTPANTIHRKSNKGTYDRETIHKIVNACPIVHVAFIPDPYEPFPVVLPMIGVIARYPESTQDADEDYLYLHGYTSARFFKQTTKESEDGDEGGLNVCVSAALVDGLVLSLTPNSHSMNFRSAVLHGRATLLKDEPERLWAMQEITNHVLPNRWSQTRLPPNTTELTSTKILKVLISSASAKIRAAEPGDEKYDLEREDVVSSTWTGIVPMHTQYGEPVPSSYNRVKEVPSNIVEYVQRSNEEGKAYAEEVATKSPPK